VDAGSSLHGERWVYCSSNLQVDRAADEVIALIERASRSGTLGHRSAGWRNREALGDNESLPRGVRLARVSVSEDRPEGR